MSKVLKLTPKNFVGKYFYIYLLLALKRITFYWLGKRKCYGKKY